MSTATIGTPHSVPAYTSAVSIVLKIAIPVFLAWVDTKPAEANDPTESWLFHVWYNLRKSAEALMMWRTVELQPMERERMIGALRGAHHLAHPGAERPPSIETCDCECARLQCELATVMQNGGRQ